MPRVEVNILRASGKCATTEVFVLMIYLDSEALDRLIYSLTLRRRCLKYYAASLALIIKTIYLVWWSSLWHERVNRLFLAKKVSKGLTITSDLVETAKTI